jgi:hypothetical protein
MKLSFPPKLMVFIPRWMRMYFFSQVFFESNPVYDQTQSSGAVFFLLYGSYILKQTWCLSVCLSDIRGLWPGQPLRWAGRDADCGQGSRCDGLGEMSRSFIHPVWMHDTVWEQTVRSASQTRVHRAQWTSQTSLDSTHRTCRGAS